jgi:predicted deacylase
MQETSVLDLSGVVPGTRRAFSFPVTSNADGTTLAIPVLAMAGRNPGPRLTCVAGVHGNEPEGITALLDLWQELDPETIDRGILVFVPVANPPAFRAGSRKNPLDGIDMNRVFPGSETGTTTERLAYCLSRSILPGSDLIMSMHGWTDDATVVPYVEYQPGLATSERSLAAARAVGLGIIEPLVWHPGLLGAALGRTGIVAIEPEIGGLGCTLPHMRALYRTGVFNLMRHLGMIDGEIVVPERSKIVERSMLTAAAGGILRRVVEVGNEVAAGQLIATITNFQGSRLETFVSPVDGLVASVRMRGSAEPGDLVAVIFRTIEEIA